MRRPTRLTTRLSAVLALALVSLAGICGDEVPTPPVIQTITMTPASLALEVGATGVVAVSVQGVDNPRISYASSNPAIASVAGNGSTATVTGIAEGSTTITATVEGTSLVAATQVTVTAPTTPPGMPDVSGTYGGDLIVDEDADPPHDEFVFDAGDGKFVRVRITSQGAEITIEGLEGFDPSALPTAMGTIEGGSISAEGSGTVAGISDVSVRIQGTADGDSINLDITVGGDGELPGGDPIRYNLQGARDS